MDDHHQPRKELSVKSPKMIWSQESVLQRIAAVSNKEEELEDADFQIDNGAGPSALLVAIKNMKKEKYEEELNPSEIEFGDIAVGGDQIEANIKKKHSSGQHQCPDCGKAFTSLLISKLSTWVREVISVLTAAKYSANPVTTPFKSRTTTSSNQ